MENKSELQEAMFCVSKSDLFNLFLAGFSHGVNEGAFPKTGTFEEFTNVLNGDSEYKIELLKSNQNKLEEAVELLSKLHNLTLYKLDSNDTRGCYTHKPAEWYDEIESFLSSVKKSSATPIVAASCEARADIADSGNLSP